MIGSRRDETEEDDVLDEEEIGTGDDDKESLSISERRARRKAKRGSQADEASDEDDDSSDAALVRTAPKDAPTRTQRDAMKARERESLSFVETLPLVGRLLTYFRNVAVEMRKVTWPTREEARRLTTIVVGVTVAFSIFLGLIDIFYGWWFKTAVDNTGLFLLVAVPFFLIGGWASWYYILREET